MACKKEQSRRSVCIRTPEIVQRLQEKGMEETDKETRALAPKIGAAISIMNQTLSDDLPHQSSKRIKCQLLTKKTRENRLATKLLNKGKHLVEP